MSKNSEVKKYQKELSKFLSNFDFRRYFGDDIDSKILTYTELEQTNNIIDLLPNEKDYKIILIQSEPNKGHWCSLLRNKNHIIWFDSYGVYPDGQLKYINHDMNITLDQDKNEILRLMKTASSEFTIEYNDYEFQSDSENVATCGRWTIWSILMNNLNYSLKDMKEFIERWKFEKGKPPDILICDWIF
jgi:hypothetical protein